MKVSIKLSTTTTWVRSCLRTAFGERVGDAASDAFMRQLGEEARFVVDAWTKVKPQVRLYVSRTTG